MKKVGHTSEFEKHIYLKNCWSGPIKNKMTLIFTMLHLKKKKERKTPRDTIIKILMIWSTVPEA